MSATAYKNIVIAGASGAVGKPILDALLHDGRFNITVLNRESSKFTFPSGVQVVKVNYQNQESLISALRGQDALISTLSSDAFNDNVELDLIDAALAAGIKRFIPSGFGVDMTHPSVQETPIFAAKVVSIKRLESVRDKMTYSFIFTGPFLDWGLITNFFGFSIKERKAVIYNGGDIPCSVTTLADIDRGVYSLLHDHVEETKNHPIYFASTTTTQNEILRLLEKYSKSKWTVIHKTGAETRQQGLVDLQNGNFMPGGRKLGNSHAWSGQGESIFDKKNDLEAFNVPTTSLEDAIKQVIKDSEAYNGVLFEIP